MLSGLRADGLIGGLVSQASPSRDRLARPIQCFFVLFLFVCFFWGGGGGGGGHEGLCMCGGDYIIVFLQMSDEPDTVATSPPTRSAPWMGEFNVNDGDPVYLIFVEKKVLCTVNSFVKSLFVWFSLST